MPQLYSVEEIRPRIAQVLEKLLQIKLADHKANLIENGFIDSLSLIEFIVGLEKEFNIEISFDDLNIDQYKDIDTIAQLIISSKPKS